MDSTVDRYEVTKGCYVPIGTGVRFKPRGSIVTLDSVDAEDLKGYVKKASKAKLKGRSELNTPKPDAGPPLPAVTALPVPPAEWPIELTEASEEVTPDASESSPDDERAGTEADQ